MYEIAECKHHNIRFQKGKLLHGEKERITLVIRKRFLVIKQVAHVDYCPAIRSSMVSDSTEASATWSIQHIFKSKLTFSMGTRL